MEVRFRANACVFCRYSGLCRLLHDLKTTFVARRCIGVSTFSERYPNPILLTCARDSNLVLRTLQRKRPKLASGGPWKVEDSEVYVPERSSSRIDSQVGSMRSILDVGFDVSRRRYVFS